MSLQLLIDQIVNGLVLGSMYALVASGLSLIWGTMKMLNFAHGELYMLGGYILFFTFAVHSINPFVAILIAVAVVFLISVAIERSILYYLLDRPSWEFSAIVATLGLSVFLQNFALQFFGERFHNVPYMLRGSVDFGVVRLPEQRLLIVGTAVLVVLAMTLVLKRTRFGMALRATSQDQDAATLYGVNTQTVYMLTFGISAILAALAATMLSPIFAVYPFMGSALLLKAFVVVVLGGLGSFGGAILGGILLGLVESLGLFVVSSEWQDVLSFIVLILILWIRPWGLFGTPERS